MSSTPPRSMAEEMQPPQRTENGHGERDYRDRGTREKDERSRSHSKDHYKDKEKDLDKHKDRKRRERSRDRDHQRERESKDRDRRRDSRDRSRERDRRRKDRDRDRERDRQRESRERSSRSHRSRSRSHTYDDYDSRRKRRSRSRSSRRDRERERSRSRSYERRRRDRDRDRDHSSRDRERGRSRTVETEAHAIRETRMEPIKEESRDNRFDLTQTIQELMNSTTSTKNFAALFNCTNSNDSFSNGPSENSQDGTERKRRKKSRWGGTENDKTFIPGMPTILPSTLDPTQQEAYLGSVEKTYLRLKLVAYLLLSMIMISSKLSDTFK